MANEYIMARYSAGNLLYSSEFIIVLIFLILTIVLWKRKADKNSLLVYLITGLWNSGIELLAQGFGVRIVSTTYLFNVIYVGYPFLCFIMGFFEGGIICLLAYHFVKAIMQRNRFSIKFVSILTAILFVFILLGGGMMKRMLEADPLSLTLTRREIFELGSIIFLTICFAVSFGYFYLNKTISSTYRKSFLLWYVGIVVIFFILFMPLHLLMIRFIEIHQGTIYLVASFWEQIVIMYGYALCLEGAGFFLPLYIIIYRLKLITFDEK